MDKVTWHQRTAEEVLTALGTPTAGLSAEEAGKRLAANGPNELTEAKPASIIWVFLGQFKSLIVLILLGAGVLALALNDRVDAIAIFAIVVLNAVIGFYQEYQAGQSIAALKKMTAPQARVRRDGQAVSIPAAAVVTGDVLTLAAGDLVAADARLLQSASLRCGESSLTGESEAVTKHAGPLEGGDIPLAERANMVFSGTTVAAGTGEAAVVATGMKTELGAIAGMLATQAGEPDTPLQEKLDGVGRVLVWAAFGVVGLVFLLGLLRGTELLALILTSVSLAVAAVPEGLPAVVTVALSLGVSRMAGRRALVRRLAAVETLGSTSVICTDKTGTLTVGEMTARALYVDGQSYEVTGEGYGPEGEVRIGGEKAGGPHVAPLAELARGLLGCNYSQLVEEDGAWKTVGDPTEGALLAAGGKAGGDREQLEREFPKQQEIPFDSDRKRSTVIRRTPEGKFRAFVNGAPDGLLQLCTRVYTAAGVVELDEATRERIGAQNTEWATQALRVLGSAYRELDAVPEGGFMAAGVERDLVFVGLTGMQDPPRAEARAAIGTCHAAGIRVVMITGDHPQTAGAIAEELGIGAAVAPMTGVEIDRLEDAELERRAGEIAVYARVTAAHKLRIVRALKAGGAVVAMTGDGVNDAPAIQGADIGIAMGRTGTEVTKQAADMIIVDDNFATIVAAVEEGRGIYNNIRKTLEFLLAGNSGELLLMTVAVAVGLPSPLLPIHLLWINLFTDGLPALCLAADPIDPDVMKQRPRRRGASITDPGFLRRMLLTGFLTAAVSFAVFLYMLRTSTVEAARAYAFTVLVFAELLRSFGVRSEDKPIWRIPFFSNPQLVMVVALSMAIQVGSQHSSILGTFLRTPAIPWVDCGVLLALGAIPLAVLEVWKGVRGGVTVEER